MMRSVAWIIILLECYVISIIMTLLAIHANLHTSVLIGGIVMSTSVWILRIPFELRLEGESHRRWLRLTMVPLMLAYWVTDYHLLNHIDRLF